MILQETCLQVSHNDQPIIGVCQNASCKQLSRKVCLQCVKELHQKDNNFQLSDIQSFDELHDILQQFQQNTSQRNEKIVKICQINKFLLLKEIKEFMSYWEEQYKSWHYLEQISIQIVKSSNELNIQNYLDNLSKEKNLKQFLDKFNQEGNDEIDQILNGKESPSVKQKVESLNHEPINEIQQIITKLTKQIEQNINMDSTKMLYFINYELNNDQLTFIMLEKFLYYKYVRRNNTYFYQNEVKELKKICQNKIFKLDDYSDKQICRKGLLLMNLEQFKEAIKYFDLIIDQFPLLIDAYLHKANILKDQNNFKGAIECLDLCIKLNPNYGNAYGKKANILKDQNNIKEAIECWDLCIKLNPNYENAYLFKAKILQDQKNFKEAIECLDLCIKLNPNYGNAYEKKANMLQVQNNFKEAIEILNLCIKINPNYGDAYEKKVKILEAIECLELQNKSAYCENVIKFNEQCLELLRNSMGQTK